MTTPTEPRPGAAFVLDGERINSLQAESIRKLVERAKHAHYTNIYMRINGADEVIEADWLKHMKEVQ